MLKAEAIFSFEKASFNYGHNKPILDEVDFSVRRGIKLALMGQNGAGKSTIFDIITGVHLLESGKLNMINNLSIAVSRQVIPRGDLSLSVREFFQKCFPKKIYDIDQRIDRMLKVVNLREHKTIRSKDYRIGKDAPDTLYDRIVSSFSGGQQARLLLASALISDPDLLLLDEPTNNLDKEGIIHLTKFLKDYKKTVIVISHDADFLNTFTLGVLYLDANTLRVEQYAGNYFDVVEQITARIERENRMNARLGKIALEKKEKANYFAMKGGRLRLLAKRMREDAAQMEEEQVDVRKEDKTIRPFIIPTQESIGGELIHISSYTVVSKGKKVVKSTKISLRRGTHLLLSGPNGIGKSTLLESIVKGEAKGVRVLHGVKIGYYRQDFSTLNLDDTVSESLFEVMDTKSEESMRKLAAGFLLTGALIDTKIGNLSEGQKGLVAFARLVLEQPGFLILDEPTNHINFRHVPVIAKALDKFEGAMILVSHVPDFVAQIRIDETLDLEK